MLNKNQIKFLKSLSNNNIQKYQVGKNEITDTVVEMLSNALTKYELIKVVLNTSVKSNIDEYKDILKVLLRCEIVQVVGGVITIYRPNIKEPKIKLPR